MKNIFKFCFEILATAIIVVGGGWLLYTNFLDGIVVNRPISFESAFLQTTKLSYHRGEAISVKFKFCKNTNDVADISVNLVNGVIWYLPEIKGARHIGCYDKIDAIVPKIPEAVPLGVYHMEAIAVYSNAGANPIQHPFISNKFEIVE